MFQRLRLSTKLTAVVAVALVGLFLVTAFSSLVLRESQIGSRRYNEISQTDELIADVLPPPQNIIEPYLLVQMLLDVDSSAEVADLVNKLRLARTEYFDRHDHWSAQLKGSGQEVTAIRDSLIGDAHDAAVEFWAVVDGRFIPAVERGDTASAESLARVQLSENYARHRFAIDQVVQLAIARRTNLENRTNEFLDLATWLLYGFIALLTIGVGVLSTMLVRSIQRPVSRLTEVARRTSTIELPSVVADLEVGRDLSNTSLSAIDVSSADELGELAAAFDAVRTTAVSLASQQADTRRNFNEMFVNLGRRNASLISRQLALIDSLERNEVDEKTLEELFRLDHLATRMRRNAESLLVLAGADAGRRTSANASIVDLIRAALSEVEDYHRVDLQTLDPIWVRGQSVSDVVHLLAELLENAAAFSPPNRPVLVYGRRTNDGYTLSIVDEGIGMSSEQLEEANRRMTVLDRFDASPSKVLGLYVVGRLASRQGIAVRLAESSIQCVTARVHLPLRILTAPEQRPADPSPPATSRAARPATSRDDATNEVTWSAAPPPMLDPTSGSAALSRPRPRLAPSELAPPEKAPPAKAPPADPALRPVAFEIVPVAEAPVALEIVPLPAKAPPEKAPPASPTMGPEATPSASWYRPSDPSGPPEVSRGGDPLLVRRTRGAQLPDTGPERQESELPVRAPEEVAGMLGRFYRGVAEGRRDADDLDPNEPAPLSPAPLSPAPLSPVAPASFAEGDLAPRRVITFDSGDLAPRGPAPFTVTAPAPNAEPNPAPVAEAAGSGLTRRVRGAQVPDTGGRDLLGTPSSKSPDEVQAMLDRFRAGVQKGAGVKPAGLPHHLDQLNQQED